MILINIKKYQVFSIGIGIYYIVKNNKIDPKTYNISNYTEKSIWRVNTILKPGEERVSPNGLVKIYVKIDAENKWVAFWRKNPNKIGKFGDTDIGDMTLFGKTVGVESLSDGITLLPSGTDAGQFNIQTVTKNNITHHVTFDGDISKASTSLYPVYFDENGIPQGKFKMDEQTSLTSFMLNTTDIDYILVRNDAIIIFDKNNKLLGVFG